MLVARKAMILMKTFRPGWYGSLDYCWTSTLLNMLWNEAARGNAPRKLSNRRYTKLIHDEHTILFIAVVVGW